MTNFLTVDVTTSAQQLADDAIARLQARWPGWVPNDADLEVIQIETLAAMAQNAAEVAATVPAAIVRTLGTRIYGIPYDQGSAATTTITIIVEDEDGRFIPAGTQITIDGVVFSIDEAITILAGTDTAETVPVTATEIGIYANDLAGLDVQVLSALDWITAVTVDAPTANGTDAQDDFDYEEQLATELQLQARSLVTLRDHEILALKIDGVGRALAINADSRDIAIYLTDDAGAETTAGAKTTVDDLLSDPARRLVNSAVSVHDATYTTVDITWNAAADPGYDVPDLIARVNEALLNYLSPLTWGLQYGPRVTSQRWRNQTIVRAKKINDVIALVDGIDYVNTVSINGGSAGADVTLTGTVPLPTPGTFTGTIS